MTQNTNVTPERPSPVTAVVTLKGGLIQSVISTAPLTLIKVDLDLSDLEEVNDEGASLLPDGERGFVSAEDAEVDPAEVAPYLTLIGADAEYAPGTLFDLTALQAVRLLGELSQQGGTPYETLMEYTDLERHELDDVLDRCSDLWDRYKARTGSAAPDGQHTPRQIADLMHADALDELD